MKLPTLNEIETSRSVLDAFGGYNHNLRIGEGEFYDMKNLTSSYYPVLSPRGKRGTYAKDVNPKAMIAKDSLCYVDGADFVINGYHIPMGLDTNGSKTLVSMGAYVIILPDAKWVNTANWDNDTQTFDETDGYGDINAEYNTLGDGEGGYTFTKFTLCRADGTSYDEPYRGSTEPEYDEIPNGQMWLDTSSVPHSLKVYSSASGMWTSIATTYIKIESAGIGNQFEVYDGVKISGLGEGVVLNDYQADNAEIVGHRRDQLKSLEGSTTVWAKGENYIVVVGILDEETFISNKITITRQMPDMDFVIESENRLWGCRYGVVDGKPVNEIYASKLGDFKNWNCFMGVSTDSYAASVGTDGPFTGAITHLGYPLFFKEGFLHKVYGNYPANYQIQTTACRGVQKGSAKSLAIVNETLLYKSRTGVCAYDGSLPTEISAALGEVSYSDAVAVSHGNKYYISMKDSSGVYTLFAYDVRKGLWHKEDNTAVADFCSCRDELYYIPKDGTEIKTVFGSGTVDKDPVSWMAESGVIYAYTPDKMYVSRINLRLALEAGTKTNVFIQYDSFGEWELLCTMTGVHFRIISVPVKPRRCDHFRIRIVGEGNAKVYSLAKTIEKGSDV
jgi:hypothetical protein